ncbi:MAG: asparagine synthase (glutamine-hydrolyzing) [Bacteroidetes bacterium]|nr:asparagine synthase (glutamine-hydrolyzing) [Bacteroidota bacterium]HET6244012.1 asparagine synthase (glutamine-hydrolyzing) [Bacteroidia bacterium]
MCGISGILSFNKKIEAVSLKKMIDTLDHRGPDGEGIWLNEKQQVGLGHKRLSIIDLTDSGKQPMHYCNGRYSITFNGEIYNYIEIRENLIKQGFKFVSNSDTEVLLALYEYKKEKALEDLDGMFAFAIWDEKEQTLFCARDRFGEKPFFYHRDKSTFSFASEMKALFQFIGKRNIDNKHIYNYFLYSIIEDPNNPTTTFFQDIHQLPPAHYIVIDSNNNMTGRKYWDVDLNYQVNYSIEEAKEKFISLFTQSITRRLRSDVTVGSSLSGGIDSSSIVMMIDRLKGTGQIQKTFSARFHNFEKDEGKFMEMVIKNSKVEPHYVYPTAESALENLQKIMYHQEMPFGSTSIAAQYEVMKLARENKVTVLLDGQGADEYLAGYSNYWPSYLMQLYRENRNKFHQVNQHLKSLHNFDSLEQNFDFKLKTYSYAAYKKYGDIMRRYKNPSSDYFMGLNPEITRQYQSGRNPLYKPPHLKKQLYQSTLKTDLANLLRYADRNSMANSIEVRLPFLSHKLVEFVFSLNDDFKINNGWTKYILRKSMEGILPDEITWRKDKIGYEPPQQEWLNKNAFQSLFKEAAEDLKKDRIITKESDMLNWSYLMIYLLKKSFN